MIRFILKAGFFLGLIALLLPRAEEARPAAETQFDVFTAMMGAQAAVADLAGFCDRAPSACQAGGAVARFAGERIGDGLAMAYSFVEGETGLPRASETAVTAAVAPAETAAALRAERDPLATGTIARAEPFAMPGVELASEPRPLPVPAAEMGSTARHLPIPRPAPRA
jgi:hypothetical protein